MPFTPFHFGPGLLGKGVAARWCSWTAFITSNVLIDCESLYYLAQGAYPVHRALHTFVGAALVGVVTVALLLGVRRVVPRISRWLAAQAPSVRSEGSTVGIVVGAMAGALSHPVLDGLMHPDIEPLQPWSAANPLRGLVGIGALHVACGVAGIVGGVLLVAWRSRER